MEKRQLSKSGSSFVIARVFTTQIQAGSVLTDLVQRHGIWFRKEPDVSFSIVSTTWNRRGCSRRSGQSIDKMCICSCHNFDNSQPRYSYMYSDPKRMVPSLYHGFRFKVNPGRIGRWFPSSFVPAIMNCRCRQCASDLAPNLGSHRVTCMAWHSSSYYFNVTLKGWL